ncbi:response regulator [Flavobacterium algicola]|uniref:response regulator n=1 Tax=Flavobacterium algicola TaxID=556529 RepID=UPI001EFCB84A|nr:response regulator [Flavobacterium algicola]MCG9791378.1 response regulator [Flavobacterium algicola]
MRNNFKRNLFISSSISLLILTISSTASFLSIQSLLNSNSLVDHTREVITYLNKANSRLVEAQSGARGYVITKDEVFIENFKEDEKAAERLYAQLELLTADNPAQLQNLAELKPLRANFFKYLKKRINTTKNGLSTASGDLTYGKTIMSSISQINNRIELHENKLLKERNLNAENYGMFTVILIIVAFVISFLITIVFFMRVLKDYNERNELQNQLIKKDEETEGRIAAVSEIATNISKGNYDVKVDTAQKDALGSLGGSLNSMRLSLRKSFLLLSQKEWLQTGIAELNNVMLGEKPMTILTKDVIEFLCVYTKSSAGALYIMDEDDLQLSSTYSYLPNKERERFKKGEGLVGQALVSGKILELKSFSEDNIKVSYAMGEMQPSHIIAIPLQDNLIEGVVELASLNEFSELDFEFFKNVASNIGITLRATQNRVRLNELLEETQSQSEELRVQHSEMESVNAELETQTEKLQASEEELRVQQEELQQTNEELSERSVLLEERNLEIQKKSEDLELSTRYKSEFLANMSHELRTPLNSILLLSRLLSENNDANMNEEQIEFAKVIQSSGNGLLGLIDEILDLSKIEAGKMDLELVDVSTKEITDTMRNLFTQVAIEKKIEFKIIDDKAPIVIKTDKMRLEQILKNLISNAIKFTTIGQVSIEIKKDSDNDKVICFIVKDTGIGIPLEKQPLIFEAFQQADGSTKRKYGGTGLGLSISRELAKLLGGEIILKSVAGEGSEFTFSMPMVYSSLARVEYPKELEFEDEIKLIEEKVNKVSEVKFISTLIPDEIEDDRNSILENDKVILIVEDDINFAKSLLAFSRKKGYKAVVAVRGDYALSFALLYKPVGVLLDIELPILNGWQVLEELKNNIQTKHIPVHIMSSHKLKQESLLKGAINFLEKPVAFEEMPEIFRRIEKIINKESKKVLIIEDNTKHAKALAYFLESNNINSDIKSDIGKSIDALTTDSLDCVILDMGIPDKNAYDILDTVKKNAGLENLPVIVFTGKSLSINEELKIKKYADSIVVKTAHSFQRMLDEVSLFLHVVEENKKAEGKNEGYRKLNMLNNVLFEKTVLVVDDDVRNIFSLTKALEVFKINVITAIDGKEALKVLEEYPNTDLVLLDMMMPNMDGYETAQRIRSNGKFNKLPVIAVTAKAMTGDREKCIKAGASDYITKPIDIDQLLSLLRVWLYDKN